jgi:hypothetical protein
MPVTTEVISFASGIFAGLFTNILWDRRNLLRPYVRKFKKQKLEILGFDPLTIGLYPINRWTPVRRLEPHRLRMVVESRRPGQKWFDQEELQHYVDEISLEHDGNTAYLVGFTIDHRESRLGEEFCYSVTPSRYSEHLATVRYLRVHPDVLERIKNTLSAGSMAEFAQTSPPSLIKINVTVCNKDNQFLALHRSGAVYAKKGLWTVGPNETMRLEDTSVPGSKNEDLFGLADRCLREELGLEPEEYGGVHFSWIGYEAETLSVKAFAHVVMTISDSDFAERLSGAHGLYEIQGYTWIPLAGDTVRDIITNWRTGDANQRKWSSSAPVALQELWRMKSLLSTEANAQGP